MESLQPGQGASWVAPRVRDGEEPWTQEELGQVRQELEAEQDRTSIEAATLEVAVAEVMRSGADAAGEDQADSGSKAVEREQGITLLANTKESLFQIQHALRRMAAGSYGACEMCGQPIGKLRLQAFPRASLCVSCKQREERR